MRSAFAQLAAFGELIGNTDMHFGNLSFYWGPAEPGFIDAAIRRVDERLVGMQNG